MNAEPTADGYALLDSGEAEKLERYGDCTIVRPSSQAVWQKRDPARWNRADSVFRRDASGTGRWSNENRHPRPWVLRFADLTWNLAPNEHGNIGVFPEQAGCWRFIAGEVTRAIAGDARAADTFEVLNLFGYTGGSTLAAAAAGARVCHVDASKTSVRQARDNASASHLAEKPIRWIVEDARRFAERELRRGRRYAGIILDPPSYGRGPKGEVWKIEEEVQSLLALCFELLADDARFFLLTSHTPGFTPLVLENLIAPGARGPLASGEMAIEEDGGGRPLPSGAWARWSATG